MIQDGRISAEDGARLLSALTKAAGENANAAPPYRYPNAGVGQGRHLRVVVTDLTTGRPHVNIRLPLSLVHVALKIGARFSPDVDGIRAQEVLEAIKSNMAGPVVEVIDDKGRERVEIVIE